MAKPAAWTAKRGAAAVAAVAVGACSAILSELIKWLKRQDGLGLPGAPPPDAASCPSPPPGAQRYIIYKVLKFGVSWGGTTACLLGPFLFSENHSWDCRPRCWGHMPQPLHHPCCLSRGEGGHSACNY